MRRSLHTWVMVFRAVLAIALVTSAFAAKPLTLVAPDNSRIALSDYVLPDGSLPILCVTDTSGSGTSHQYGKLGCDLCRLTPSVVLPCPQPSAGLSTTAVAAILLPPRFETVYRQFFPPSAPPRGPPSHVTI